MGVGADLPVIPKTIPLTARGESHVAMPYWPKAGATADWIMEIPIFAISD